MSVVDVVVVVLLLGAAWSGFTRGLIGSGFALIGAITGAVAGLLLAPLAMRHIDAAPAKVAVGIALVVLGIGAGEIAGSGLGRALSDRITFAPARLADRGLGLIVHTAAIAVVTWLVALPLASVPAPWLASAVRSSAVLRGIDAVMPTGVQAVSDQMRRLIDDSGFPAILEPLTPTPDTPVAAPDAGTAAAPAVVAAGSSVLKVRSRADSCSRMIEGSGFVIGPERLLTNAHVVAGADTVTVQQGGASLDATVVEYDPERDLAVLAVPDLSRPVLRFAAAAGGSGTPGVAVGYPLDGPLTLTAGRIRDRISLRGPDIYDQATVVRDVYTLRATVRPGNSGGPLIGTDGTVLGVVFGASVDKPDVGFALTAAEAAPDVSAGLVATGEVSTGSCTSE